jgi:2-(1,2-epoxy-1,2-dihydrophenyl)acetyl-CoA isomerase
MVGCYQREGAFDTQIEGEGTDMNYEVLIYDKVDKVAKITLNRPERMNALDHQIQQELAEAVEQAGRDDDVRAVVLTGAGRGFCAGADFRYHEVREGVIDVAEAGEPRGRGGLEIGRIPDLLGQGVILRLHNMDKPTIAMVNGAAAGAGFDLALACDMRIGSEKARFIMSFTRIGVPPGEGGCWTLPRVVGLPKAFEIIFTGDPIEAEEAYRIGLLNRLVPGERLEEEAMGLARKLAQGPPIAHRLEKLMIHRGLDSSLESALAFGSACVSIALQSEDHVEGVAAFAAKRQPIFRGK